MLVIVRKERAVSDSYVLETISRPTDSRRERGQMVVATVAVSSLRPPQSAVATAIR